MISDWTREKISTFSWTFIFMLENALTAHCLFCICYCLPFILFRHSFNVYVMLNAFQRFWSGIRNMRCGDKSNCRMSLAMSISHFAFRMTLMNVIFLIFDGKFWVSTFVCECVNDYGLGFHCSLFDINGSNSTIL